MEFVGDAAHFGSIDIHWRDGVSLYAASSANAGAAADSPRWQEINRSIIERPHLQRLLRDARFTDKTDEEIAVYNFIFQIVNSCYELHFAKANGLIDREIADRFLDGNADVLRGRSVEVLDMLNWNRGYDKSFCNDMRERLLSAP